MIERYFPKKTYPLIEEDIEPWVDALEALDEHGDKKPLIKLLQNNVPMPWPAPWHLADFLNRHDLTKQQGRGGKRTPSYGFSPALQKLIRAKRYYEFFRAGKKNKDQAMALAATRCDVTPELLRRFISGKYASARRIQKRRPPPNPRP